jgi:SAM-dependent methyltransferase
MRVVRDSPRQPDPGFAELYASLPDVKDLEPWLGWCREARPPVLYLGVGTGRLAAPLCAAGQALVGLDAHPGMLARLRAREPGLPLVRALLEEAPFWSGFDLVIAPSSLLGRFKNLCAAARLLAPGGRLGLEMMNPHWLAQVDRPDLRVLNLRGRTAAIEIDYPGGFTQAARDRLWWPEDVESRLRRAGLRLERMFGSGPDLIGSPTYCVLASKRLRRAQIPST